MDTSRPNGSKDVSFAVLILKVLKVHPKYCVCFENLMGLVNCNGRRVITKKKVQKQNFDKKNKVRIAK